MAPSNGTLRMHPAMAPRPLHPALAPWCHVQSAKVVRRPRPLLEVRTPIAIAIWGKNSNHEPRTRELNETSKLVPMEWNEYSKLFWLTYLGL